MRSSRILTTSDKSINMEISNKVLCAQIHVYQRNIYRSVIIEEKTSVTVTRRRLQISNRKGNGLIFGLRY